MKTSLRHQVAALPCAIPGRYLMTAMQSAAGSNLNFVRDRLLFPRDALTPDGAPTESYARLGELAATSPPGAAGLLYLPWLAGERTPVDDPSLRATLLNVSLQHTRADLLRAVLEGVALNTRWMLDAVNEFLGETASRITLVGGGGESELWAQIFADTLGVAVRVPLEPIQANVRGAAFLAGVGIGALAFEDIPERVPIRCTFEPRLENRAVYADRYAQFRSAHRQLSPFYRRAFRALGTSPS
jgi:xylulokinase